MFLMTVGILAISPVGILAISPVGILAISPVGILQDAVAIYVIVANQQICSR